MVEKHANQVVLITGSSRGLGLAIAERYVREGAVVTVCGLNRESVDTALSDLSMQYSGELLYPFVGDLTQLESNRALVDGLMSRFGKIDVAVCNLGGGSGMRGVDIPESEWMRLFDLNFHASRRLTEILVGKNQPQRAIVYISSIVGSECVGAPIPYEVAKAGLNAYAKAVSFQMAKRDVRVNVISPGNILAPGGTWEKKLTEDASAVQLMLNDKVSMQRLGNAREIAEVVHFVASASNSFMTGSNVIVDGGQVRFT